MKELENLKPSYSTLGNPTPRQLAALTAFTIAGMILVCSVLLKLSFYNSYNWVLVFVIPIFVWVVSYWVVSWILAQFIYTRVKLIYKTISTIKAPKQQITDEVNLDNHILDDIENKVKEWGVERMKEVEDLRAQERFRRNFLGNINHELKTPIFNLQGYLNTLLEGAMYDENVNQKYLKKAIDNVDRLESIVEDLTTISKLETNELPLNIKAFDIEELFIEALSPLEHFLLENKCKVAFKREGSVPFMVEADRNLLRQVLDNLLTNAIKYGASGTKIKIGLYDMHNKILVEVADNGPGIAAEHLPHLFERFYRVDSARSRDVGGTGLGLSIVKHIIESHNQAVFVRSTEGLGTTFGFTLPKYEPPVTERKLSMGIFSNF
jgi:two-component system phosphate regulon sensor histidine kinase PhoR